MLLEVLVFISLGIIAGTITGLIPGIHINLIGAILISSSIAATSISSINSIVFITSMAITHTFIDFIPSVFLGCPDTDTELSILPGHKMLSNGKGYEAVILTTYGSLAAIFILVLIIPPSFIIIPKIYKSLNSFMPLLLIAASAFLIGSERNKFSALKIFFISGILGICVLNLLENSEILLTPLLTGLFGASSLIISIKNSVKIPKQEISVGKTKLFRPLVGASIASPLCSFLPGLGSGQAAIIGTAISRTNQKGFLVLLGATNTLVMGFSFISLYLISKTRTGAAATIYKIIGVPTQNIFWLIIITLIISGIISFFLAKILAKIISQNLERVNYKKISSATLVILTFVVLTVSGILGLIVLVISTLTGIYCISLGGRRTNMMGCLMLPTILFYLI